MQGGDGEGAGCFEGGACVVRPPTVGFNLNQVGQIIHRLTFLGIGDRRGDESQADEGCFGRCASDTDAVVASCSRISGAGGPVIIAGSWAGICVVAVPVFVVGGVDVGNEIGMARLKAVIDDADSDSLATNTDCGGVVPDCIDIHI